MVSEKTQVIVSYQPKDVADWKKVRERLGLKPAILQQTMGPHWKHIVTLIDKFGKPARNWAVYNEKEFKKFLKEQ